MESCSLPVPSVPDSNAPSLSIPVASVPIPIISNCSTPDSFKSEYFDPSPSTSEYFDPGPSTSGLPVFVPSTSRPSTPDHSTSDSSTPDSFIWDTLFFRSSTSALSTSNHNDPDPSTSNYLDRGPSTSNHVDPGPSTSKYLDPSSSRSHFSVPGPSTSNFVSRSFQSRFADIISSMSGPSASAANCSDSTSTHPQPSSHLPNWRTRSLNAPSPIQHFGPCGRIMKNSAMVMQIQDPASQRLTWYKPPLTVLVIKKIRDVAVLPPFVQLVQWLIKERRMVVFVEASVMNEPQLTSYKEFNQIKEKLMTFQDGKDDLTDKIDFIICLGGDGTLLYASLLFQQSVPPIMAFHLGSLGFLTPFEFENFQEQVTNVLEGDAALTLRSRLRCIILRKERPNQPQSNILVLNEVVIDRGPSPYLSNIDLFLDGKHITSVQGDGLIVSTPTGSTAYAVAAGASMIHPSVPAIMVTPICPHSLSFRPIVVPAGVELKIMPGLDARNPACVSFDGRCQQQLGPGDSLQVTTSIFPVPSICAQDQISDWFDSLAECLHWNVRKKQKHLEELSDLTLSSSNDTLDEVDQSQTEHE